MSATMAYYINRRKYKNRFRGPRGSMVETLAEAGKFSLLDAAQWVEEQRRSDPTVEVVLIEETPGTSTIRLVSTRTIDATKPVVLYDVTKKDYFCGFYGGPLEDAKVFTDLNDALTEMSRQVSNLAPTRGLNLNVHVHQVEVVPGAPTVTETVLA